MRKLELFAVGLLTVFFVTSPAAAAIAIPATPGPLVGAGVPAAAGLAYVFRRLRAARSR